VSVQPSRAYERLGLPFALTRPNGVGGERTLRHMPPAGSPQRAGIARALEPKAFTVRIHLLTQRYRTVKVAVSLVLRVWRQGMGRVPHAREATKHDGDRHRHLP